MGILFLYQQIIFIYEYQYVYKLERIKKDLKRMMWNRRVKTIHTLAQSKTKHLTHYLYKIN